MPLAKVVANEADDSELARLSHLYWHRLARGLVDPQASSSCGNKCFKCTRVLGFMLFDTLLVDLASLFSVSTDKCFTFVGTPCILVLVHL